MVTTTTYRSLYPLSVASPQSRRRLEVCGVRCRDIKSLRHFLAADPLADRRRNHVGTPAETVSSMRQPYSSQRGRRTSKDCLLRSGLGVPAILRPVKAQPLLATITPTFNCHAQIQGHLRLQTNRMVLTDGADALGGTRRSKIMASVQSSCMLIARSRSVREC